MAARTVRIGTRPSPLALHQAELARAAITAVHPDLELELVEITSRGDTDQRPLAQIDARGLFASELEHALAAGEVDVCVHSAKDLPVDSDSELALVAALDREDARDAICADIDSLDDLPSGARIATGSARRSSILATLRADLQVSGIRGNVATRLERSRERGDQGCMLAVAGLRRLGLDDRIGVVLDLEQCVPDPGQGIVVLQARTPADPDLDWDRIGSLQTLRTLHLERAIALELGGGCDHPVGVHVEAPAADQDREQRIHVFRAPAPGQPGSFWHGTLRQTDSAEATARWVEEQVARIGVPR